jgi:hypothetical protein
VGQQSFCTEARVREIVKQEVNRSVIAYEAKIGAPRHQENQRLINRIDGGVTVLKVMGSFALIACAIVSAYVALHHR